MPDKIEHAITALYVHADTPALYSSSLEVVDEQLNFIRFSFIPVKTGFGNALVKNIALGCTMVLNKKAVDFICNQLPYDVYFHDWWCYLVISRRSLSETPVLAITQTALFRST